MVCAVSATAWSARAALPVSDSAIDENADHFGAGWDCTVGAFLEAQHIDFAQEVFGDAHM